MKSLFNIENFGIELFYNEGAEFPFVIEYSDAAAPIQHTAQYLGLSEALSDIANRLMNIDNVYCPEDLPDFLAKAYKVAGFRSGCAPYNPEATDAVYAFLYIVLEGIANFNMRT